MPSRRVEIFPSLTIQKSSCLHREHGRGPQLWGLSPSREAEALAFEPESTPLDNFYSFLWVLL